MPKSSDTTLLTTNKELNVESKLSLIDSLVEEMNIQDEISQDLIPYLKQDVEKSSSENFDWDIYKEWYRSADIHVIMLISISLCLLLFISLGLLASSFYLFASLGLLVLQVGLLSSASSLKKKTNNQLSGVMPKTFSSELHIKIIQHNNQNVNLLLKRGEDIIKQKTVAFNQGEVMQDIVLEWEEEIKSYNHLFNKLSNEYNDHLKESSDTLQAIVNTFDNTITTSEVDKYTDDDENNIVFENQRKRYNKITRFVTVITVVGLIGVGTATGLSIDSKSQSYPSIDSLNNATQRFVDSHYKKYSHIPSKEETAKFISTQPQSDDVDTKFMLDYFDDSSKGYKNFKEGYYVKFSPKQKGLLPKWFSWERERGEILAVDYSDRK